MRQAGHLARNLRYSERSALVARHDPGPVPVVEAVEAGGRLVALPQPSSTPMHTTSKDFRARAAEGDFARVLVLIASDPAFERALLDNADEALSPFSLDPDELAVLRQYRRWRIPF